MGPAGPMGPTAPELPVGTVFTLVRGSQVPAHGRYLGTTVLATIDARTKKPALVTLDVYVKE